MPDKDPEADLDKDQTTRPSLRKDNRPIQHPDSARQPRYDRNTTPDAASGDPTE
ncbi:hypothetical protein [Paracoccus sp. (in: a-proteobacteria)]|uniref:hypothetical protein n=1 Tax=Paracoccus sp. TaxID=267 RepID=UPI0035AE3E5D